LTVCKPGTWGEYGLSRLGYPELVSLVVVNSKALPHGKFEGAYHVFAARDPAAEFGHAVNVIPQLWVRFKAEGYFSLRLHPTEAYGRIFKTPKVFLKNLLTT
jgi:hypothetical protein